MVGAEVNYTRISAIVELQDAQGWKSLSDTPRYRAQIDRVEISALDVYTLIVDKIEPADAVVISEQVIFEFTKVITDEGVAIDSISFDMTKPLSDSAQAGENITFQLDKVFSDNFSGADSTIFSMNKALQNNAQAADSIIFNMQSDGNGGLNDYAINEAAINLHAVNTKVF